MRYFKGKQFKKDIILIAVGYYCRFSLSYHDVSEILQERRVSVPPTTIMRWVHEYGNLIYQIWKKKNKTGDLNQTPVFQRVMNFKNYLSQHNRFVQNFSAHLILKNFAPEPIPPGSVAKN